MIEVDNAPPLLRPPPVVSYKEEISLGKPRSPSPFCLSMPPSSVSNESLIQARVATRFKGTEEFKDYATQCCFLMLSSFQNNLEYFYEYIKILRKVKVKLESQLPRGEALSEISKYRKDIDRHTFFLEQCEAAYRDMAIERGCDPELIEKKFSGEKKFRTKHFGKLNWFRLFLGVRLTNLAKDACVVAGTQLSQGLFVQLSAAFSWTPFLGWLFYLPRMLINIVAPVRNAMRSKLLRDAPKEKKGSQFRKALKNNLDDRRFENANDWVWAIVGLITCFWAATAVLTPLLYLYDVGVEIARSVMKIKMWTQQLWYAYANAVAEQKELEHLSEIAPEKKASFVHWEGLAGSFDLNRWKNPGEIIDPADLVAYQKKEFLRNLYTHIAKKTVRDGEKDLSLRSVSELHSRTMLAWSFHIKMVRNRMKEGEERDKLDELFHDLSKRNLALKHSVSSVLRVKLLSKGNLSQVEIKARNHSSSLFFELKKKLSDVKKGAAVNLTCVTGMAAGMIMTFVGGGHAVFNTSLVMPAVPMITLIGIAIVVAAALTQIIYSSAKGRENPSLKYGF